MYKCAIFNISTFMKFISKVLEDESKYYYTISNVIADHNYGILLRWIYF